MASADLLISSHLRKQNYDILTSFEPICYLATVPMVIVVNSATPYRTLADLLDAARSKPGDLTLAGTGPLSVPQIGVEMLKLHLALGPCDVGQVRAQSITASLRRSPAAAIAPKNVPERLRHRYAGRA